MVGRVVPDEDRELRIELVDPLDDARPLPLGQRIDAIVDRSSSKASAATL
jgi:hypothetical protein